MLAKIAEEWLLRGFSCCQWVDPPGKRWEDYKHKIDELFMLLEGDVELEINGKLKKAKPNEIVLIPAHTRHSICNVGKNEARWLYGYKMPDANQEDITLYNQ